MSNLPLVALTLGDPAGIGPEIVVKAMADEKSHALARCLVVGDAGVVEKACADASAGLRIKVVTDPADGEYRPGVLNLVDLANIAADAYTMGEVNGACGRASYDYIAKAIELANAGKVQAVATTPINKESLRAGGVNFIGHTEIFGALTGTPDPLTMFEVRGMRVFFLSRHVSLRKACDLVTMKRIVDYVRRCVEVLGMLGVDDGVMAVAGLNPHSGEHGLFGDEEMTAVAPAVSQLQSEGYRVAGPIGAESVFHLALIGRYNSVLSLYHDQGHIATKTLDFERTIAVTGGMPILRTSVDHGTAFDIAGKNLASPVSLIEAVAVAAKSAPHYPPPLTALRQMVEVDPFVPQQYG
ncbi:MAG: 4-hydroxythreonine-4-phosphate dehydrogenase PdxA [Planctomycetes bacterium]|nr:4-hydroxythreonine-4-phosphate dehydrogenase PdxA [Planctomycetota bacterium]